LRIWHKGQQVQGHLLDEIYTRAHQPIELGAIRQGGEGLAQATLSIAKEVALASEAGPPSEDGQGYNLAVGEGWLRTGPLPWRTGLAKVVDNNVECSEEGVHIDHKVGSFPFGIDQYKPTRATRSRLRGVIWNRYGIVFNPVAIGHMRGW
jgi:hypothetical protein